MADQVGAEQKTHDLIKNRWGVTSGERPILRRLSCASPGGDRRCALDTGSLLTTAQQ